MINFGHPFLFKNKLMDYIFEELSVNIHDKVIKLLQISNVDEVFDALIAQDSNHIDVIDERIPYWTELWPSAIGLSWYLLKHEELIKDKRVLEIGCGLALPSIAAGFCKPMSLVASDYLADSLKFVERNWKLNHENHDFLETKLIDWRKLFTEEYRDTKAVQIILASDVVYEKRYADAMLHLIENLPEDVTLILSEPGREVAREMISQLQNDDSLQCVLEVIPIINRNSSFNITILGISKIKSQS